MSSPSKNPSPLLKANIFSRFFHWYVLIYCFLFNTSYVFLYSWLSALITKSRKQGTLHLDDLYDIPAFLESTPWTDKLEKNWFDEIRRCPQNPSLIRATLRTMGWKLTLLGLLLIPLVSKDNHIITDLDSLHKYEISSF
jgi:hypothetical protein